MTALVHSIQTVLREYGTGDKPLLVSCNDGNGYVCKHAPDHGSSNKLFYEYLSASFLKIWELPVPDFAFVKINPEHLIPGCKIAKSHFRRVCFGSQYNASGQELTRFTDSPTTNSKKNYTNHRNDAIKVSLFDIWIGNEDRHQGNYNLLIDPTDDYKIIPIDHGAVLNTGILSQPIEPLTIDESLACSTFVKKLFNRDDFNKVVVPSFKEYFYLCTRNCKEAYHEILNSTPTDWQIDLNAIARKIEEELLSPKWHVRVLETLFGHLNSTLN